MKSLMIGQVSKEYGAFETTGAALVAIELAKHSTKELKLALYATNIPFNTARKIEEFNTYGYSKNWITYLWELLKHPISSVNHLCYYMKEMGVNPLRFFFYEVNIRRTIKSFKPDIIHVHGLTQYMPAYYAANDRIPLIVTLHGYWYTNEKNARIERTTMPFVSNITTLTMAAKHDILKDYPKEFQHFNIVANGADTNKFFYSESNREELRRQWKIDNKTVVFITVASIQERKGQLKFLQFLHKCGIENFRYLIIGKGDVNYIEVLNRYILDNNLSDNVSLVGYVDNTEMFKYYSVADFYAHVSTNEGQSLSEMEAASTGLRIIVNKPLVETLPDVINGTNDTHFILDYETMDYGSFINWINRIIKERKSVEYYSWDNVVANYYEVYNRVVGNT